MTHEISYRYVIKRNNNMEPISFDKITNRISHLINNTDAKYLDPTLIAQKVIATIYSGITTEELDIISAEICINLSTVHPLYSNLGGRLLISNLHKKTLNTFSEKMKLSSLIDNDWLKYVLENANYLDDIIDYKRDYNFDYFGFKTLEKSYLLKEKEIIIERPQDMLLRTAITLQMGNLKAIEETYNNLSFGKYIHATPTLYNSGTHKMQLSSCFLMGTNDNLTDIMTTMDSCVQISKWAGGIGLHISNIRGKNSIIHGTGGLSNGIIPLLKVYNELSRWIDQGGKRPGSFAIYLEPHHPDILDFLELRKNFGAENNRTRDLFLALWISDLFMEKVDTDGEWYLFSPDECPNLNNVYGNEYTHLYNQYINENKYRTKMKARKIWMSILESQIETGMPYILYKDTINEKNNQQNLGIIRSSNLCVHGDTKILTDNGYYPINILKNCHITIWNGYEWSTVIVRQTGINKKLIRIEFSNYVYIDCTPEHKFYINQNNSQVEINASNLKIGDILISFKLPNPLTYDNCNQLLSIKQKLIFLNNFCKENNAYIINNILYLALNNKDKLLEVRLMLHTISIESQIIYIKDDIYSLLISNNNLLKLIKLDFQYEPGIEPELEIQNIINKYMETYTEDIKVISINESYQNADTYCMTEPLKHTCIFNGIIAGNCAEIVQYSDHQEYAVCNLASIAINKCIKNFDYTGEWIIYTTQECIYCDYVKLYLNNNNVSFIEKFDLNDIKDYIKNLTYPQILHNNNYIGGWNELYNYTAGIFDYEELYNISYLATINLNNVIDVNYYPVPQTKKSNMRHRPIGLGIQGLADTLAMLRIPFDSNESIQFNSNMMETIYLAALTASNNIAIDRETKMTQLKIDTIPEYYDKNYLCNNNLYHELKPHNFELNTNFLGAYSSFENSLFSKGLFQFNLYYDFDKTKLKYKDKWEELRTKVIKHGTRNSLLTALMPTASTSNILGNNECFEYFTNNIYTRKTTAGDFILINKYLINDLIKINLWNNDLKDKIIANYGSIQTLNIPINIKKLYKTIWEIKQIWVLKNAKARSYFVDQTQSMNIFIDTPDYQRITSCHFYSWKNKLKTGMYYLRSKPSNNPIQFTIEPTPNCVNCSS